jgi:hypothetical protein
MEGFTMLTRLAMAIAVAILTSYWSGAHAQSSDNFLRNLEASVQNLANQDKFREAIDKCKNALPLSPNAETSNKVMDMILLLKKRQIQQAKTLSAERAKVSLEEHNRSKEFLRQQEELARQEAEDEKERPAREAAERTARIEAQRQAEFESDAALARQGLSGWVAAHQKVMRRLDVMIEDLDAMGTKLRRLEITPQLYQVWKKNWEDEKAHLDERSRRIKAIPMTPDAPAPAATPAYQTPESRGQVIIGYFNGIPVYGPPGSRPGSATFREADPNGLRNNFR